MLDENEVATPAAAPEPEEQATPESEEEVGADSATTPDPAAE